MIADLPLARDIADRQVAMFTMFVGPGLYTTRAALSDASRVPTSTLKDWANGSAIPFHGVMLLRKFLPPSAINMLAEPGGARIIDAKATTANWDEVAARAAGLTADICEARMDGVITPSEGERLRKHTRELIANAQAVVDEG